MFDNAAANEEEEERDILEEVQTKAIAEIIDEEQIELEANNNDIEHEVPKEEGDDLERVEQE